MSDSGAPSATGIPRRRRRWPWVVAVVLVLVLVPIALVAVPILTYQGQGASNQDAAPGRWPLAATATGDDGRDRSITIEPAESGQTIDTSALTVGERFIVRGDGFDGSRGIYVAVCLIPAPREQPGPCVGGVPEQAEEEVAAGTIQFAPSNWINDDWAWRLFGARSYDSVADGTFTAYLEVGNPVGENFDCRVDACGIFTRNDHTALRDRVQDLFVPVGFAPVG
ncbi:MAG: hypothetical protein LH471_02050 [Salinibacterium sp.]|nr:hypothetical protein [Salinibacterium sp.]